MGILPSSCFLLCDVNAASYDFYALFVATIVYVFYGFYIQLQLSIN